MKDLGYYMSLLYDIKAKELPKDAGGGVFLSIPLLGEATVNAYGDTYEEARKTLESVKQDFFQMWLNKNVDIPEPSGCHHHKALPTAFSLGLVLFLYSVFPSRLTVAFTRT